MNKLIFFLLPITFLLLSQCVQDDAPNPPELNLSLDCTENPEACDLVTTINQFGFDVFKKMHQSEPNENAFISPLSISTALSMTLNGAEGETKAEMMKTLNLQDWQLDEINKAYLILLSQLPNLDEKVKLQIANSIWYREDFQALPDFLDINSEFYGSEIRKLDFTKPDAVDEINSWVEDKTEGLIDKILNEIPGDVVMYLINAIYFKGEWTNAFDPDETYEAPFTTPKNEEVMVDYMSRGVEHLAYFENDVFQAVNLPYGDSLYAMSIFLPKEKKSVQDVINELSIANWKAWDDQYESTEILFALPKFELKYEKKLNQILSDLGMKAAFLDKADFSKINGVGGLKIDEVRHKSFITVDEKGTEAAAVTVVVIVETSVPQYPIMQVNRPFVFVIRDHETNSVLFIGKVLNPTE